jgi:hypothetical protein
VGEVVGQSFSQLTTYHLTLLFTLHPSPFALHPSAHHPAIPPSYLLTYPTHSPTPPTHPPHLLTHPTHLPMQPLDLKLIRDLTHLRGQVLAIVLIVACGIASLVTMLSAYDSLQPDPAGLLPAVSICRCVCAAEAGTGAIGDRIARDSRCAAGADPGGAGCDFGCAGVEGTSDGAADFCARAADAGTQRAPHQQGTLYRAGAAG